MFLYCFLFHIKVVRALKNKTYALLNIKPYVMSYWCQIDRPNTSLIDQITLCDIIFKAYYTTTTEEPFAEKSVEDIVFDKNVVKVVIADIENAAPETDDDDDVDDDCAVTLRTGGHEIEDGGYVRAFFGELTQVRS